MLHLTRFGVCPDHMSHVERHDDVVEVDIDQLGADSPDDLVSAVTNELQSGGPVRQLVVRLIGAPRGMASIVRSLATEAGKRNVQVRWRL
jgi:hypothetical protein